jgi:hypothetical protein
MPRPAAAFVDEHLADADILFPIVEDLCPVWRMMSRSLTPFMAAWVTHPARGLWPPSGAVFM